MSVVKTKSIEQSQYPRQAAIFLFIGLSLAQGFLVAGEEIDPDTRNVHDPAMIFDGSYAYVYSTGIGNYLEVRRSSDLLEWEHLGDVFSSIPQWVRNKISGVGNLWAPDITYHNGKYYLCYSASTFGSQTSLITLLSNDTLDPFSPDYEWVDEGEIIDSPPDSGSHTYNAIDGTFVRDAGGNMWLVFGSYWDGIMLTPLNSVTLKPTTSPPTIYHIAHRSSSPAIEAAYITYRNGYYYLFVNFDACCQGVDSTYKIVVGRSISIFGPYTDKNGHSMMNGGGTLFLDSEGRWIGPGHAAITKINRQEYFSYHAYDGLANGNPTLRINEFSWDEDGWPALGDPVVQSPPPVPQGPTVVHWNFEDGVPGTLFDNIGSEQVGAVDLSVNGFNMYAQDEDGRPSFSAQGQTPSGFGLSARFDGNQNGSATNLMLNRWSPKEWTIELAVKLDTLNGWQTMIGRDGSAHGDIEADFYFQKNDFNNRFRVNIETVGGQRYILDANFIPEAEQWYYLAAVCDGISITMYTDKLDSGGSQVVGSITLNPENDNALASGVYNWTFGRGWFNGNPVDYFTGNLDHIRFSDYALTPEEFLSNQCGAWGYLENDMDYNCRVAMSDLVILSNQWDGTLSAFESLAMQWLGTTDPLIDGAIKGTVGGPDPH